MIGRIWQRWKQQSEEKKRQRILKERRSTLASTDFGIVANNCWGGEIYKYYDLPFNTPFIGLFLYPDCYLRLLENWDQINLQEIILGNQSRYIEGQVAYPVGMLDHNIEIHFLHYHSLEEAESKWKRRAERLRKFESKERLFVKFCDRDGATEAHFERFHQLPFPHKISMSAKKHPFSENRKTQPEPGNLHQADDGVKVFWYELDHGFDLSGWLNS